MTMYKLFEQDMRDGKLYPLFIGKKKETKTNIWIPAEIITDHKGFAHRPGWHTGAIPAAPWLMGMNGLYNSGRGKNFRRVWCEVETNDTVDYTETVQNLPKKCFTDQLPEGGFYFFRETGGHVWVITDAIKIVRILSEDDRKQILDSIGYNEQIEFLPYLKKLKKAEETRENNK